MAQWSTLGKMGKKVRSEREKPETAATRDDLTFFPILPMSTRGGRLKVSLAEILLVGLILAIVSVGCSYVLRRLFERLQYRAVRGRRKPRAVLSR